MARQRTKQLEATRSLSKTGSVKSGFDSDLCEEDDWVLVKKQRVIIVLPSLPVSEPCTFHDPATSQSLSNLRDVVVDNHEKQEYQKSANFESQAELEDVFMDTHITTTPVNIVEIQQESDTPATSQSLIELRDVVLDTYKTASRVNIVELQKPATFQSQGELRDLVVEAEQESQKPATPQSQGELRDSVMDMVEAEQESQNPATSQSQGELRDFGVDMVEVQQESHEPATSQFQTELQYFVVDMVETEQESNKPAISQFQAKLQDYVVDMVEPESDKRATSQFGAEQQDFVDMVEAKQESIKPATSQTQAELRDAVMYTEGKQQEGSPEAYPDDTLGHNLTSTSQTTRKSSKKPNQESVNGLNTHRTGQRSSAHRQKPYRFPRVMCSSSLIEGNESELLKQRLRMVNLEKKVEKAGGLNQWIGSIGLGKEFERMFKGQRLSKYQVANLTMEKLKHMGAVAVGPRRKLIHAIRCVYHPHCIRAASYLNM